MYHINDPDFMTPEERFQEIAVILAKGFLRLKMRQATEPAPLKNKESERFLQKELDSSGNKSVHEDPI